MLLPEPIQGPTKTKMQTSDPNALNESGWTPLHQAAMEDPKKSEEVAKALLEGGAEPDKVSRLDGKTPLHYAAMDGHKKIVKLLLEKGANPNSTGRNGATPLHLASSGWHPSSGEGEKEDFKQVIKLLLDAGAHPDEANDNLLWY